MQCERVREDQVQFSPSLPLLHLRDDHVLGPQSVTARHVTLLHQYFEIVLGEAG